MIRSSRESFLLVDSSKFNQTAFVETGDIRQISKIITDIRPSDSWLDYFKDLGVECLYPENVGGKEGEYR